MEDPGYRAARVREAIVHDERVADLSVDVRIVGQSAFLSGTVTTTERRTAAEEIARHELPELTVVNEIDVAQLDEPSEEELS